MPTVAANNVRLNYVENGQGLPPLLLLHGLGGSHEMWGPVLPALAADRRVVAGDHRGHGASDKPAGPCTVKLLADDWIAAMDELGMARADVLGLSLGGAVAMRMAVDHPTRVRRLVLVDTWAFPHPDFIAMLRERLAALHRGDLKAYAEIAIPQVYSKEYARQHPEDLDAYRERIARAPVAPLTAAVEACIGHDMRGELKRIVAPTLVMVGGQDCLTPRFHADYVAAAIQDARLVVIPEAAHVLHQEALEDFLRTVLEFLGEPP